MPGLAMTASPMSSVSNGNIRLSFALDIPAGPR